MNLARTKGFRVVVAVAFAWACGIAAAQTLTLYKLIDKKGKVTYSEEKPKEFDGKVVVIEVDMGANKATMPKFVPPARSAVTQRKAQADKVDGLKERLAQLQAQLEEAINRPGDEDIQRIGIVGGRTRPVPTEEYLKRLADLEAKIKATEDELSVERRK